MGRWVMGLPRGRDVGRHNNCIWSCQRFTTSHYTPAVLKDSKKADFSACDLSVDAAPLQFVSLKCVAHKQHV